MSTEEYKKVHKEFTETIPPESELLNLLETLLKWHTSKHLAIFFFLNYMCSIRKICLRYYNIDPPPGLPESTDLHAYHCSYDISILIEDPL